MELKTKKDNDDDFLKPQIQNDENHSTITQAYEFDGHQAQPIDDPYAVKPNHSNDTVAHSKVDSEKTESKSCCLV
jgi:hypothetical protein